MPKAKKSLSNKEFNNLNEAQQIAELRKLAKRANVRLSLQEEKGIANESYRQAQYYNESKGKDKNRFYEGKKYNSKSEIKQAYEYLTSYLDNKSSTLGGLKKSIFNKVDDLVSRKGLDYDQFRKMSKQEKIYVNQRLAVLSNRRIRELDKEGIDYYAYEIAQKYNLGEGRKDATYYRGSKLDDRQLDKQIKNEIRFMNAQTSTIKGLEEVYNKRINTFRNNGINIPTGKEQEFLDFLSSKQFETLKKYASSNQIIETFTEARNKGEEVDKINSAFKDFLEKDNLTFDQVQEKLNVAKWQGRLFH